MKYFEACIKPALKKLYEKDKYLLENGVHEQTISARLAKYLEDVINEGENEICNEIRSLNIDCEYNKNRKKLKTIGEARKVNIRPDIICHKRGTNDNNIFVVEIKKKTDICDEYKIKDIVEYLSYKEGYAIQEFTKRRFYVFFYENGGNKDHSYYSVKEENGDIIINKNEE